MERYNNNILVSLILDTLESFSLIKRCLIKWNQVKFLTLPDGSSVHFVRIYFFSISLQYNMHNKTDSCFYVYIYIFFIIYSYNISWNFIVYFGKNIINIEQLIGFIKKKSKESIEIGKDLRCSIRRKIGRYKKTHNH